MFESGMRRARTLDAGGRNSAGILQPVRRCAAQSFAAAGTAVSNADASAGELPADGPETLIFLEAIPRGRRKPHNIWMNSRVTACLAAVFKATSNRGENLLSNFDLG
jgi:hypothetical protein